MTFSLNKAMLAIACICAMTAAAVVVYRLLWPQRTGSVLIAQETGGPKSAYLRYQVQSDGAQAVFFDKAPFDTLDAVAIGRSRGQIDFYGDETLRQPLDFWHYRGPLSPTMRQRFAALRNYLNVMHPSVLTKTSPGATRHQTVIRVPMGHAVEFNNFADDPGATSHPE